MTAAAADIRQAICNTLNAGCERSTSWFPYPVTLGGANYPAGMITWATGANTYGESFDPTDVIFWDLELHVRGELVTANVVMDDYLIRGSTSAVVDVLSDDSTLDGLITDVWVTGFDVDTYDGPDEDYVARLHLRIMP
jgi:hypothetical protein